MFEDFLTENVPNREGWNTRQITVLEKAFNFSAKSNKEREDGLFWYIVFPFVVVQVSPPLLEIWLQEDMPEQAIDGPFKNRDELFDAFKKWKNLLDNFELDGIIDKEARLYKT